PSGAGKTTALKLINRLLEPTEGDVLLDGRSVHSLDASELRRRIGYVIQQVGLFPHQNVAANIATVPRLLGWDKPRIRKRVRELDLIDALPPSGDDRVTRCGTTLRDALAMLLEQPDRPLVVVDDDGQVAGLATAELIERAFEEDEPS